MTAILRSRQTLFFPEVIVEVEYIRKIAISISDILIDALAQILTEISISKSDLFCELVTS